VRNADISSALSEKQGNDDFGGAVADFEENDLRRKSPQQTHLMTVPILGENRKTVFAGELSRRPIPLASSLHSFT